jgi:anti-sigma regulatory factor (Ser/Thr protein kinase)
MTSRQASDETVDDAVFPTRPEELPAWLASALDGLLTGSAMGSASYVLDPEPESVTDARHFTIATLRRWGMAQLCEDAALVISELVTNALRHSLPPRSVVERPLSPGSIRMGLLPHSPYALCGVVDAGTRPPRRREPDFIAETGRGLHLVDSFSSGWGWIPLPNGCGKMVWALFGPA